ncbi:MAG: cation-transporting P-type ATPase, partial [Tepidisphaeraceae bacterium]
MEGSGVTPGAMPSHPSAFGLSHDEVTRRRQEFGLNELPA